MVKRYIDSDDEFVSNKKIKYSLNKYEIFEKDLFDDNLEAFKMIVKSLNRTSSSEYKELLNYIDYVMKIPFNKIYKNDIKTWKQKVNFLKNAKEKLNKVLYGHDEVKTEILCYLANILQDNLHGTILGLEGPAGCGKTELIKNGLGDIINRPVFHISLGGITDGTFLDGFDFCYKNSKWGIIVDTLIKAKSLNPIIFFDELDKVSEMTHGDEIINKLIHIIDPIQNSSFKDRYFKEFEIDLSNIIFIFSFNDSKKINKILLDRIKVIKMNNYMEQDKLNIIKDYILPKMYKEFNIDNVMITDECIKLIINSLVSKSETSGIREIKNILNTFLLRINLYKFIPNEKIKIDFKEKLEINFELFNKIYEVKKTNNGNYLSMYC